MAAHDPNDPLERMLSELEAAATTDMQETLVKLLRNEIRERQATQRCLQRRVKRLETTLGVGEHDPVIEQQHFDDRDQAVLRALRAQDATTLSLSDLQELYRRRTDIRRKYTLRERIRTLTTEGPFERTGHQEWRYTGTD